MPDDDSLGTTAAVPGLDRAHGRVPVPNLPPGGEAMMLLKKDGKVVATADDYNQALAILHNIQGQSWDYALKYGGYSIEDADPEVAHDQA